MPGPGMFAAWSVPSARRRMGPGGSPWIRRSAVFDARLRQPAPLDLEGVRGRILLDQVGGPVELRRDLLEDPGGDLEPLPRAIEAHEFARNAIAPFEVFHERLEI